MKRRQIIQFGAPVALLFVLGLWLWLKPPVKPATPTEMAELAIGYMKAERADMAKETFQKALAQEPENFRANYGAGQLALKERRLDDAERYLKVAYKANPDELDVILTLGAVYQTGKAYKQAEMLYQAVRKVQPQNAKAAYNLGFLEISRRDYPKAKSYLEEYLRLVPKAPDRVRVQRKIQQLTARIEGAKK